MGNGKWEEMATGVSEGAGIDLHSRDLARIAQLYLQEDGRWPTSIGTRSNGFGLYRSFSDAK